jgi:hypothetical protein
MHAEASKHAPFQVPAESRHAGISPLEQVPERHFATIIQSLRLAGWHRAMTVTVFHRAVREATLVILNA